MGYVADAPLLPHALPVRKPRVSNHYGRHLLRAVVVILIIFTVLIFAIFLPRNGQFNCFAKFFTHIKSHQMVDFPLRTVNNMLSTMKNRLLDTSLLGVEEHQLAQWNPVSLTLIMSTAPVLHHKSEKEIIAEFVYNIQSVVYPDVEHVYNAPDLNNLRILVHNDAHVNNTMLRFVINNVMPGLLHRGVIVLLPSMERHHFNTLVHQAVQNENSLHSKSKPIQKRMNCNAARNARLSLDYSYALAYAARLDIALISRHSNQSCKRRYYNYLPHQLLPSSVDWWSTLSLYMNDKLSPLVSTSCFANRLSEVKVNDWLMLSTYTSDLNTAVLDTDFEIDDSGRALLQDGVAYSIDHVAGLPGQLMSHVVLAPLAAFLRVRYSHKNGPVGAFHEFLHIVEEAKVLRAAVNNKHGIYAMVPSLFDYAME